MILGIVLTLMTLGAAALVVLPLLRSGGGGAARSAHELEIYRDQLSELDRDVDRGLISADEAEAARGEIGRRILAVDDATATAGTARRAPVLAAIAGLAVPALALLVYLSQGSPSLPGQPGGSAQTASPDQAPADSGEGQARVAALADALEKDPARVENWVALGDALTSLKRYQRAAVAYTQAMQLAPLSAEYASRTGEALTFAAGGQVTPDAGAAFREALRRDPGDPRALYYLGLADRQGGRLRAALDRWLALEAGSPPDAPWLKFLTPRIASTAMELGIDKDALAALRRQAKASPAPGAQPGPSREQMEAAQDMSAEDRAEMIRGMVDRLAARLEVNPDDAAGWQRLGRARAVLGDKQAAKTAMGRAAALRPNDIDTQLAYADAIVDAAEPDPPPAAELKPVVDRILARDDRHPRALWMSGALALSANDPATAKRQWTKLLEFVDPNSPRYVELKNQIDALPSN